MIGKLVYRLLGGLSLLVTSGLAHAHHPLGGELPASLTDGLISGLAHPVIGFDHLAFVLMVGVGWALLADGIRLPLAFIAATVVGCLLRVSGFALPLVEIVVVASLLAAGLYVLAGRHWVPASVLLTCAVVAGVFHGTAYAVAILGVPPAILAAYLLGFATIQLAIAGIARLAVTQWGVGGAESKVRVRLAGAVAAGIGVTLMLEMLEASLFATSV